MEIIQQAERSIIQFDPFVTLALIMLSFFGGRWLCRKVSLLQRYCIPAPIVGGTAIALLNTFIYLFSSFSLSFDTSLQVPTMTAFFACTGLIAGSGRPQRNARGIGVFFAICVALLLAQNLCSILLASLFGLSPALGIVTGSAAMTGGHGTVIPFAYILSERGATQAVDVALAAATFGLVAGSALGGPLATWLIGRYGIISAEQAKDPLAMQEIKISDDGDVELNISSLRLFKNIALMAVVMGVSALFRLVLGVFFPEFYIPPSIAAMILGLLCGSLISHPSQNHLADNLGFAKPQLGIIGELMLIIFLTLSSMTMQLWELIALALPLMLILLAQVAVVVMFALFIVYPLMRRSLESAYEGAVTVAGFTGFGLGIVANALANMDSLTQRYGEAPAPYLILPLVGSFLIDMVNLPVIMALMNFFS